VAAIGTWVRPATRFLLLFAIAAGAYALYAAPLPFFTRGEPREALVARSLLTGESVLLPRRDGGEIHPKPPLFHWLAAAGLRAGVHPEELAVRLPSVVLAAATVALCGVWAAGVAGSTAGLLAALVLGSSFEWLRAATESRVDMTLVAFVVAATVAWRYATTCGGRWSVRAGFVASALATLAKGPVGLVLPLLVTLLDSATSRASGRVRRLLDTPGLLLFMLVTVGWYVLAAARGGAAFLWLHLFDENVVRFLGIGTVPHAHSAMYYVPALAGGLLPWTPIVPTSVWQAWKRRDGLDRFCLVWIGAVFGFYALASGKRSVYLLPLYPPVAVLVGRTLDVMLSSPVTRRTRRGVVMTSGACLLVAAALLSGHAAAVLPDVGSAIARRERDRLPAVLDVIDTNERAIAAVLALLAGTVAGVVSPRRAVRIPALVSSCVVFTSALAILGTRPLAERLSAKQFAHAVRQEVGPDGALCALGEIPDDLRYYLGRSVAACRLDCATAPAGMFVVRRVAHVSRRLERCLRSRLLDDRPVVGDEAVRLDEVHDGRVAGGNERALGFQERS